MKILIVGLGSMGKRRIRLLQAGWPDMELCGVDTQRERRDDCGKQFGIAMYDTVEAAIRQFRPEAAFVCTSPTSHAAIIETCLNSGLHVFSEINLVSDGYAENCKLAEEKGRVLFLSSTFLYREETRRIVEAVASGNETMHYTYHVGQYLPDWHPWEDYQTYFVGRRRTNGCRELLAIELPWILAAFGEVEEMHVVRRSRTALPIPYPDSCFLTFTHAAGHVGQLLVDVASRVAVRHFEGFSEHAQIEWRGTPEELWIASCDPMRMERVTPAAESVRQQGYGSFIVENAYADEIRAFFERIRTGAPACYGFEEDLRTLRLIDRIEGQA